MSLATGSLIRPDQQPQPQLLSQPEPMLLQPQPHPQPVPNRMMRISMIQIKELLPKQFPHIR